MSRIYSLQDADAILPEIVVIVQRLQAFRDAVIDLRDAYRLADGVGDPERREASPGADAGVDASADRERIRLRLRGVVDQMQADAAWLDERDIALRDIASGLLDFPGEDRGEPIWLCWRLGEDSVAWWHTQSEGFAGRRPVDELG